MVTSCVVQMMRIVEAPMFRSREAYSVNWMSLERARTYYVFFTVYIPLRPILAKDLPNCKKYSNRHAQHSRRAPAEPPGDEVH